MKRALLWLAVMNIALQIPWSLHDDFAPLRLLAPVGELVLLAVAVACWPRRGGWLLAAGWLGLMLIEIDRLVGIYLMGQDPLFYDQLFLIRHLLVLASDLWTPSWAADMLGILAATAASLWLLGHAVRGARRLQAPRPTLAVLGVVALLGLLPASVRPVRWISPEVGRNVHESVTVWWGVNQSPEDSPHQEHAAVSLARRPDVQLYIVESYGRVLATSPLTQQDWLDNMDALEAGLSAAGWQSASAWSTAPVSGGRSWLADASVLLGMPIYHESVYRHLMTRMEPLPDLVEFFDDNGYRTVRVAPKDRARPGVALTNDLRFGQQVTFKDLDYRGPPLGWGWIPDQFSLGHVAENVLDGPPLFLLFHMVTSHYPWTAPPPILDEWRSLELLDGGVPLAERSVGAQTRHQLRRYKRRAKTRVSRGTADGLTLSDYARTIEYDLEILRRHLTETAPRDALVIIMGDHQPPLVYKGGTMDVPVHVLSRDPLLLDELLDQGFTPGMAIEPGGPTALRHEGFFSLLVRALARCCSDSDTLPAYLPAGTPAHP